MAIKNEKNTSFNILINLNLFHEYPYLITLDSTNLFLIFFIIINKGISEINHLIYLKIGQFFYKKVQKNNFVSYK
jgi:hypothetical protein